MGATKAWSSQNNQRSIHISNPLSLSKKSKQKSKEFEVGTYILLEIDWSERWGVEPWSRDKVWCENLSEKRYFNFGGFDDLGVLSFYLTIETWSFAKIQICWGFHSSCYSRFGGFHFQKSLARTKYVVACKGTELLFFHAYFEGFYGHWNSLVKKLHIPKVIVKRGE